MSIIFWIILLITIFVFYLFKNKAYSVSSTILKTLTSEGAYNFHLIGHDHFFDSLLWLTSGSRILCFFDFLFYTTSSRKIFNSQKACSGLINYMFGQLKTNIFYNVVSLRNISWPRSESMGSNVSIFYCVLRFAKFMKCYIFSIRASFLVGIPLTGGGITSFLQPIIYTRNIIKSRKLLNIILCYKNFSKEIPLKMPS